MCQDWLKTSIQFDTEEQQCMMGRCCGKGELSSTDPPQAVLKTQANLKNVMETDQSGTRH